MPRAAAIMTFTLLLYPALAVAADAPALIAERLSLMKDVAIYKSVRDIPVEDLQREAVVIDAAVKAAALHGLEPETTRVFFKAQIDAAKAIQACWIERWSAGEVRPADGADLVEEIRPELLRLGDAIVAAIALDARGGDTADLEAFEQSVSVECLSQSSRSAIARALAGIQLR
ncbi:gamma subclass chorismate mutase AroQ [Hoeflea poritis]|uniref:chorismate mutase n=1 Tax=Hoeflea poritis TaxID=2993659 RepID=A0ABT4VKR0_9HYPH|nr:gamma subclass chorismate mutase AroQ [Hoeflea poritis]MDA4845184.1 gamma subclass chorismate mutase AroQ [Hoeflea poritis]